MIINIFINIKEGSGGNNATLFGDFALGPSEKFNFSQKSSIVLVLAGHVSQARSR